MEADTPTLMRETLEGPIVFTYYPQVTHTNSHSRSQEPGYQVKPSEAGLGRNQARRGGCGCRTLPRRAFHCCVTRLAIVAAGGLVCCHSRHLTAPHHSERHYLILQTRLVRPAPLRPASSHRHPTPLARHPTRPLSAANLYLYNKFKVDESAGMVRVVGSWYTTAHGHSCTPTPTPCPSRPPSPHRRPLSSLHFCFPTGRQPRQHNKETAHEAERCRRETSRTCCNLQIVKEHPQTKRTMITRKGRAASAYEGCTLTDPHLNWPTME